MRIAKVLTVTVASAAVLGGIPSVQASEPVKKQPPASFSTTIKEGRKAVRSELKKTKSASASVALVSGGKTVWSQTFGRVNKAGKKPSSTTQFGIGSVSKMVTATAVMQLVDQGKVSLDAPVVRYVPDFSMLSPQYKQITVRMLLNHSAGLPGGDLANAWGYKPIPSYAEGVLAGLANSHLKTTPGAMNIYCNDCFTLAGVVVERVSGVSYQDYVKANILKPLGMRHSSYQTSVPAPGTVAPVIEGGQVQPIEITNFFASGGLMSTSDDMAQFAKVFTGDGVVGGKRILSSSAIQQMGVDQGTTTLQVGPPAGGFGLGWDSVQEPALKSAGVLGWTKNGATTNYSAQFAIAPDQGLAVVVEGAGRGFGAGKVAQTVLLNALVETGAVKTMPKQVSGMPCEAEGDAAGHQADHRNLPGPWRVAEGDRGEESVAEAGDTDRGEVGEGSRPLRVAQERGVLVHQHARHLDPVGQGVGPHLLGAPQHRHERDVLLRHDPWPADPLGGFVVAGMAGPGGQEVVAGQREPQLAVVDPVRHPRRGDRVDSRPVRVPRTPRPSGPKRSLRCDDQ